VFVDRLLGFLSMEISESVVRSQHTVVTVFHHIGLSPHWSFTTSAFHHIGLSPHWSFMTSVFHHIAFSIALKHDSYLPINAFRQSFHFSHRPPKSSSKPSITIAFGCFHSKDVHQRILSSKFDTLQKKAFPSNDLVLYDIYRHRTFM
jgi:hypothetical protein